LDRSLWSIHRWVELSMWMASPLPLPAGTLAIFMFRTMTLLTPFMFSPQPVRPELEPTPRIVLFEAIRTSAEQVKLPLTRMIWVVLELAALVRSVRLETLTVGPPLPPVVPPLWVAHPIRPLLFGGGLLLVVVGGGLVVVGGGVVRVVV